MIISPLCYQNSPCSPVLVIQQYYFQVEQLKSNTVR